MDDLQRVKNFLRGIQERSATETVPFDGGTAFLNERFPIIWDMNLLVVEDARSVTAASLVEDADEILGGRGMHHRKVEIGYTDEAERIAEEFQGYPGWERTQIVSMVLDRESDRAPIAGTAEEVPYEAIRELRIEITTRGPYANRGSYEFDQLIDKDLVWNETGNARHFVARLDGKIVSGCNLYMAGDVAQVEEVDTLEEARNKGFARAIVQAAIDAARGSGLHPDLHQRG